MKSPHAGTVNIANQQFFFTPPSKCPTNLFGPVSNRAILKQLHVTSRSSSRNPRRRSATPRLEPKNLLAPRLQSPIFPDQSPISNQPPAGTPNLQCPMPVLGYVWGCRLVPYRPLASAKRPSSASGVLGLGASLEDLHSSHQCCTNCTQASYCSSDTPPLQPQHDSSHTPQHATTRRIAAGISRRAALRTRRATTRNSFTARAAPRPRGRVRGKSRRRIDGLGDREDDHADRCGARGRQYR